MNLDEAIDRYSNNAKYERTHGNLQGYLEFKQLAEWLKDYKRLLEQQPCERFEWGIDGNVYKITKAKDGKEICQQVCRDAISREAVLEPYQTLDDSDTISVWLLRKNIEQQPPVTPQQKYGKWIIVDDCEQFIAKCSECGRIEDSRMISNYPYCHCGAKMQESEDK